jgi:uncharacterized protein (DUF952 family)
MPADVIYKVCSSEEWDRALACGSYGGSRDDMRDGFIHLSTRAQIERTLAKFFAGRVDLFLLTIPTKGLALPLRWEKSGGGDIYPHLYAPLPVACVTDARPLAIGVDGTHDLSGVPA